MSDSTAAKESLDFRAVELIDMHASEAVRSVVEHAFHFGASDIFLLSQPNTVEIKMRSQGVLRDLATVPTDFGRHMISHMKAEASMDIAESRLPQDGRWVIHHDNDPIDMRLSTIATLSGEDLAIRISHARLGKSQLDEIGMSAKQLVQFKSMLESRSGLLLVTGPTGVGKTTTLYSALNYLADGSRKINTIEDPIEKSLSGVRQSQVNPRIGLTFAEILRSLLRQAPDVIMVGEIRDEETAKTAVRAATSGVFVIATTHAPIAAAPIQSLVAMGVKPYFLANCLLGVVAQQLVRKLCPNCRSEVDLTDSPKTFEEVRGLLHGAEGTRIYGAVGCEACDSQGYSDRTGLFEILQVNHRLRRLISDGADSMAIHQAATEEGMIELRKSALVKMAQGEITLEEVMRQFTPENLGL